MTFDPDLHHRRSIRLRNFDYASAGAYFVTICAQGRDCLFGEVVDGVMAATDAGRMVESVWSGLPERFPSVALDAFVIMPNHVHFILFKVGAPLVGALSHVGVVPPVVDQITRAGTRPAPTAVGDIVGAFKSVTTHEYSNGVTKSGWPPFPGRLWQRNYFERIIRNDAELDKFRTYILHNPTRWSEDEENPLTLIRGL
jgi:putative transposase